MLRLKFAVAVLCGCVVAVLSAGQSDLDAFMGKVLAQRDQNWKKLQQYVLDERESIDLRGPGHVPIWGERRDYTWYIRDGFFVRSPVRFNGVEIADSERREYEATYLKRQQAREKRRRPGEEADQAPVLPTGDTPRDVDGLLKQSRQPGFISSAYFLRFRFEEGKYALVGHETLDGRDVLRIEYYPSKLFGGSDRRRNKDGASDSDRAHDAEFQRMMNKAALVTLWVEPNAHQIVKYTFNNLPLDFLPAQWLVHVDDLRATMTMGQPFPDVWLPGDLELQIGMTLAIGQIDARYAIQYHDYRQADVTTKVKIR
jgi:hypothetical protein